MVSILGSCNGCYLQSDQVTMQQPNCQCTSTVDNLQALQPLLLHPQRPSQTSCVVVLSRQALSAGNILKPYSKVSIDVPHPPGLNLHPSTSSLMFCGRVQRWASSELCVLSWLHTALEQRWSSARWRESSFPVIARGMLALPDLSLTEKEKGCTNSQTRSLRVERIPSCSDEGESISCQSSIF